MQLTVEHDHSRVEVAGRLARAIAYLLAHRDELGLDRRQGQIHLSWLDDSLRGWVEHQLANGQNSVLDS